MRTIYLLRHGRTEANEKSIYCGATDLPLSEGGSDELKALRRAEAYPDCSGCRVYTSGLTRTEETLRILYGETAHTALPGLREMNFGDFELHSYGELMETEVYREWVSGNNVSKVCPGGESGEQMNTRVLKTFREILEEPGDVLIVSHGGPIAAMMEELFPDENKNRYAWQPKNGRGYAVRLGEHGAAGYTEIPSPREKKKRPDWETGHYAFFQNLACEYFPCHATDDPGNFNCLFCYCPLYALGKGCGGNCCFNEKGNKDCTACDFPHRRENYPKVVERFGELRDLVAKNR